MTLPICHFFIDATLRICNLARLLRSRIRQRHRARTASLPLRWCLPGILTGPGAGENNES